MSLQDRIEAAFDTDEDGNVVIDPDALPDFSADVELVTAESSKKLPHPSVEYGNLTTTTGLTLTVPDGADPLEVMAYAQANAVQNTEEAHAARVEAVVRKDE